MERASSMECDARSEARTQGALVPTEVRAQPRTPHRDEQRGPAAQCSFRRALLTAAAAVFLVALAAPAVAAAPAKGVFVPGASLGGVELGMSKAEVRAEWGSKFGVCRNCAHPTWYFNLKPFEPQGAGVELRRGRVARVFTVWRPLGWRTAEGLELGAQLDELRGAVPGLQVRPCEGYTAYVDDASGATSVYYVFRGRLWGFGITSRLLSPCL